MFDVRGLNVAIELWGVSFGLVFLVCVLVFGTGNLRYRRMLVYMMIAGTVSVGGDAAAGIFRGASGRLAWVMTHVGNFATYAGGFVLVALLTWYLNIRIVDTGGRDNRTWSIAVSTMCLLLCVLTLFGAFYHIDSSNIYHRSSWYWTSQACILAIDLFNTFLVLTNKQRLSRGTAATLLFYAIAPVIASLASILVYGLAFSCVAIVLGMIILFIEYQQHTAHDFAQRTQELAQSRVELSESRVQAMVSQIQPHFIFNALDSIYLLCEENPPRAQYAIDMFSTYLRANLDSLRRTTPVPIERELDHVRTYFELEKVSMEDLLEWDVDMQATGFEVPALAVQTLAENAVRHGVGKKPGGGKVIVRTREDRSDWLVSVQDNGVGFDVDAPRDESHVGLVNTSQRTQALCGGALEVTSEPGKGTTAVLRIPKERS